MEYVTYSATAKEKGYKEIDYDETSCFAQLYRALGSYQNINVIIKRAWLLKTMTDGIIQKYVDLLNSEYLKFTVIYQHDKLVFKISDESTNVGKKIILNAVRYLYADNFYNIVFTFLGLVEIESKLSVFDKFLLAHIAYPYKNTNHCIAYLVNPPIYTGNALPQDHNKIVNLFGVHSEKEIKEIHATRSSNPLNISFKTLSKDNNLIRSLNKLAHEKEYKLLTEEYLKIVNASNI